MSSASKLTQIRRNLLCWYDKHRRPLPWRSTRDAYSIWIAETMLQQTQVTTVLPYYRRFLSAFPTLKALDQAPKSRVLALWSGLGYYRRAENLKKAARTIARWYAGKIPRDYHVLLRLPGIGLYTAGALMSIAFNRSYAALDGNAKRVLSRVFNMTTERELWNRAKDLVPPSRPGHFNQALMELGSSLCSPRDPSCTSCPLSRLCKARTSGAFLSLGRSKYQKPKNVQWPLAIIEMDGRVLLHRRQQGGLLAGLWEIPGGPKMGREKAQATLTRHLIPINRPDDPMTKIGEIRHSITHHRIRSPLFVISGSKDLRLPDSSWRWVPMDSLNRYPLSSLSLKAVKFFQDSF